MSEQTTTPAAADALTPVDTAVAEQLTAPAATAETATATDADAVQETQSEATPRDPKSGRFAARTEQLQAQISNLRSEKGAIEREVATLQRNADRLRADLAKQPTIDPNDFAAADSHRVTSAMKTERLQETQQNLQDAETRAGELRVATFQAKLETARERIPDLDQALASLAPLPFTSTMAELITDSDRAPELAVWFSRNPAEVYRIASLPAHRQGMEIARIESRVTAPAPKRISSAPAPLATSSGATAVNVPNPDKMSPGEYRKFRMGASA
jgi:hypothetical protein